MITRKSLISLATAGVSMLLAISAQATRYYVANSGNDLYPGTSTHPFKTIQRAINMAQAHDTIQVAAGTYLESIEWNGKDLTIVGAGDSTSGSMINGGMGANVGTPGLCVHAANLTSASSIQGFLITAGENPGGGGMLVDSSDLTISSCAFTNNLAAAGGGICNINSSPTISNCSFQDNGTYLSGGGVYNESSDPIVINCTFFQNAAGQYGGAMFSDNDSRPTVTNCTFSNNESNLGGAMYNATYTIANVTNCLFVGNHTPLSGGGMYNETQSSVTVTNCTFSGNLITDAGGVGGGIYNETGSDITLTNCIVWGNTAQTNPGMNGPATASFSDIQGLANAAPDANGNFAADPLFTDAVHSNMHLQPASPCRDRGANAVLNLDHFYTINGVPVDLDDNPRLSGSRIDLGAFEILSLADVSGQVSATKGSLSLIPNGYSQPITLKNTSNATIYGPISLIVTNLKGFKLSNATGTTVKLTPAGQPYINATVSNLAPGASTTITLRFIVAPGGILSYGTRVVAGTGSR
jgi:hypothetical protein